MAASTCHLPYWYVDIAFYVYVMIIIYNIAVRIVLGKRVVVSVVIGPKSLANSKPNRHDGDAKMINLV
jgi:hypothetical protein